MSNLTLTKEEIKGRYGAFNAYVLNGNTLSIKDKLKFMGFKWYPKKQVWWISEKKFTPQIQKKLKSLEINIADASDKNKSEMEETDDPKMSEWYGFPIKKNIKSFNVPLKVQNKEYVAHVIIDRSFQKGKTSNEYKTTKSREHRYLPKYIIHIRIPEINYKESFKQQSKIKWGEYDENEKIADILRLVDNTLNNTKSRTRVGINFLHNVSLRDEEYKEFLNKIGEEKIELEYDFRINDTDYGGNYKVKVYDLGMNSKSPYATIGAKIESPHAPKWIKTFGYSNIDISNTKTINDFHDAIKRFLKEQHDFVQKKYIEYLKSFPFLESQKSQAQNDFNEVYNFIKGKNVDTEFIFRKLQEKGYIRPYKRQRQSTGLTMGDEIKWFVNSSKIVDDAYGNSYVKNTPDYFYSVIAYYIHRRVRNITSFTDMMLVDAMRVWMDVMKSMGADLNIREIKNNIETIGDEIINKINHKIKNEPEEEQAHETIINDPALIEFANFIKKYDIESENLKDNIRNIYRVLVNQIHPDKFVDPIEKQNKTKEFQKLQLIWEKIPKQYKSAFNWYNKFKLSQII